MTTTTVSRKTKSKRTTRKNKSFLPKYLIHATYHENVENIIKEGIRPSSNTGIGVYKYDQVEILTKPHSKKSSNIIKFDKIFTQVIYDPDFIFNDKDNIINQEIFIILDLNLIKDVCIKNSDCYVSNKWRAGKKIKNRFIDYDPNITFNENMQKWHAFLKDVKQNELIFNKPIDPKYIKAILFLPPMYKNYYIDDIIREDGHLSFKVYKNINGKIVVWTSLYMDNATTLSYIKRKYPNIRVVYDWDQI